MKLCSISSLSKAMRHKMMQRSVGFARQDISKLWPTHEELRIAMKNLIQESAINRLEYERQMQINDEIEQECATIREDIASSLKKMPNLIVDFQKTLKKDEEFNLKREEEKKKLLLQLRSKYEFRVDVNDAEYLRAIEEKAMEKKKEKRALKKLQRLDLMAGDISKKSKNAKGASQEEDDEDDDDES